MKGLKEKRASLEKLQADMAQVFEQAGAEMDFEQVKALSGTTSEKVAAVRKMNDEMSSLGKEIEAMADAESVGKASSERAEKAKQDARLAHPNPGKGNDEKMSLGDAFIKAGAHQNKHKEFELPECINLKTLFETTAGWAPETLRTGRMVENAQRPIQVMDLIPGGRTGQAAIVYMEETTFTNNAAEVAEGGSFPEAVLALTERSVPVKKIAVFLPVTDEQLEDVPQVSAYLNNRLPFMLMQRLDGQILNGNGVGANLTGILNTAGIQTQAAGGDPTPDAVYKAMTKVRVTGRSLPSGIIMHPNDWQDVRLLRTADGIYIWGSPSEAGPERMWGLPIAQADSIAEGTSLVGDFRQFIELVERRGVTVKVSDSHSDFFIKGKQAIRADVRVALPVYRPAAFCTVTGI